MATIRSAFPISRNEHLIGCQDDPAAPFDEKRARHWTSETKSLEGSSTETVSPATLTVSRDARGK